MIARRYYKAALSCGSRYIRKIRILVPVLFRVDQSRSIHPPYLVLSEIKYTHFPVLWEIMSANEYGLSSWVGLHEEQCLLIVLVRNL